MKEGVKAHVPNPKQRPLNTSEQNFVGLDVELATNAGVELRPKIPRQKSSASARATEKLESESNFGTGFGIGKSLDVIGSVQLSHFVRI